MKDSKKKEDCEKIENLALCNIRVNLRALEQTGKYFGCSWDKSSNSPLI